MKRVPNWIAGLLCTALLVCSLCVTAGATVSPDIPRVTSSTAVPLSGDTQKIFAFPIAKSYGYWKIAIRNTASADLRFEITADSPSGEVIYSSDYVSANSSFAFYSDEPLEDGTYYVTVRSAKGSVNLSGTLWYKQGVSYDDIAD